MKANIFKTALDSISNGIIIVDSELKIVFWNNKIERLSGKSESEGNGLYLSDIFPRFNKPIYKKILIDALERGQTRFCSGKLHGAFVYNESFCKKNNLKLKQNMIVKPIIINNNCYIVIEIIDISQRVTTELRLTNIIQELEKGYEKAKISEEYNRNLALKDALTGLLNRKGLKEGFEQIIRNFGFTKEKKIALMFLDIDYFKTINDTYGHLVGDSLLNEVGKRLSKVVKSEDLVCRIAGDEFVIVLLGDSKEFNVNEIARNVLESISSPYHINGKEINITASIGISFYNHRFNTLEDLIERADIAMYRVKNEGRNNYKLFE